MKKTGKVQMNAKKIMTGVACAAAVAAAFGVSAADDTAVLQELFAGEGDVVVPVGNYTVSGQLTVDKAARVRGATGDPKDVVITLTGTAAQHLLYVNNATVVVSGLTLVGGQGVGKSEVDGYGRNTAVVAGVVSNCVLRGATLTSPAASQWTTAVCVNGPSAVLTHSTVSNNVVTGLNSSSASKGVSPGVCVMGGGRLSYSLVAYNRDTGSRNAADGTMKDAAGVTIDGGAMDHCVIAYNEAPHVGGVRLVGGSSTASKCLVFGNESNYRGVAYDEIQPGTEALFADSSVAPADLCLNVVNLDAGDFRSAPGGAMAEADVGIPCKPVALPYVGIRLSVDRTIAPMEVMLEPSLLGLSGVEGYRWSFGDASEIVETADTSVSHRYEATGRKTVSLTVLGAAGAVLGSATREIVLLPRTRTVASVADLRAAVAESVPGCTIALETGTYDVSAEMRLEKGVRVVGATGLAKDVKLRPASNVRGFYLSDAAAFLGNLTIEGTDVSGQVCQGMGFYIDRRGGTVSNVVVRNMTFSGTLGSPSWQSAASAFGTLSLVTHTVVSNNSSKATSNSSNNYLRMAGVDLHEGAQFENSLVARNVIDDAKDKKKWAGGVWGEDARLVNCTVVGNSATTDTGGLYLQKGSAVNCVVVGNASKLGASYDDIYPGTEARFAHSSIGGNVSELFVKYAEDDFTPSPGSALSDTGTTEGISVPEKDLVRNARISGKAIDIGCIEFDASATTLGFSSPKTDFVSPAVVTFTATTSGFAPTDELRFYWDFDNDGVTDVETSDLSVTYVYSDAGRISVSLTMTNLTTKAVLSKTEPEYLYLAPPTMYVDGRSSSAEFPYDRPENAASNVQMAVDAAVDGVTIVVESGDYLLDAAVSIGKGVTVRGKTGDPADVRFVNPVSSRTFYVNNRKAKVESVTMECGQTERGEARNLLIDTLGGTVSNCIVCGGSIFCGGQGFLSAGEFADFVEIKGASALMTHCVVTNNSIGGCCKSTSPDAYSPGVVLRNGAVIANTLVAYNTHSLTNTDYQYHVGYAAGICGNGHIVNCTVVSNMSVEAGGICFHNVDSYDNVPDSSIKNTVVAGNVCVDPEYATRRAKFTRRPPPEDPDTADRRTQDLASHSVFGGDVTALFKNFAAGNYIPQPMGPLAGAGTLEGIVAPSVDLLGRRRVQGRRIDIGAIEGDPRGLTVIVR